MQYVQITVYRKDWKDWLLVFWRAMIRGEEPLRVNFETMETVYREGSSRE